MGQEYAPAPKGYEAPMVNSVRAASPGDSGSVQVGGYFFVWNTPEGGFTNEGWYMNSGPFKCWGFSNPNQVTEYLRDLEKEGKPMNLNEIFQKWSDWYYSAGEAGMLDYDDFASQYSYGCRIMG